MGRKVSGKELSAGQHEFDFVRGESLLSFLAKGPRSPQKGKETVSVKENLVARTTDKVNRLSLVERFETEFAKYAGKFANTARIFEKVIGRKKTQEEIASV